MCKKILRILSLALAILLAVSVAVPSPVTAAATRSEIHIKMPGLITAGSLSMVIAVRLSMPSCI